MLPNNWWGPTARHQQTKTLEAEFGTGGGWAAASMASHAWGQCGNCHPIMLLGATSLSLFSSPLTGPVPAVLQAGSGALEKGPQECSQTTWSQGPGTPARSRQEKGENPRGQRFCMLSLLKTSAPPRIPCTASVCHPGCQGNVCWFGSHTAAASSGPSLVLPNLSLISRWRGGPLTRVLACSVRSVVAEMRQIHMDY